MFVINAYVKPTNTSSKTHIATGSEILDEIDFLMNSLFSKGDILLCGHFNACIGLECNFIRTDENGTDSFLPSPDDYIGYSFHPKTQKILLKPAHTKYLS